ncbi:BTB/POZ and MATH domain-containing protein 2-like [Triticum dicoccoides]|uniref:BTB/POZ and MATH domain-containing protein 2-like n=1 Tax=Triticum dicoccoides TaxID=85692 RepID=UPI00188FBE1D|nr:BTB/POZ and MATH domain-containing protein 2-like [Triticum dicoccoides]
MAHNWTSPASHVELLETSSRCVTESRTHNFDVAGYSLDGMGVGKYIRSSRYSVGGYHWCIRFYPDGESVNDAGNTSCFLCYLGGAKDVKAKFALTMLRTRGIQAEVVSWRAKEHVFSQRNDERGRRRFVSRWSLKSLSREGEGDGCFTIRCVLTVRKETPLVLQGDLEPCIGDPTGADVTFRVGGQEFPAHRFLLAARSPVFRAQLFGPMAEKDMGRVKVVDVEPAIFQMMLHYIYTDSLPPCDDRDGHSIATLQHLLRLMCEKELCEKIDVKTVRSTFALANQHKCEQLE